MSLAALLLGAALAGRWAPPLPLEEAVQADGTLLVPAGEAVRLVLSPAGTLPGVSAADGSEVPLRGEPDGVLIPQAGISRALILRIPEGARVAVRYEDQRGQIARWYALDDGARSGPLPPSLAWVSSSLRVLDEALSSREVRALARAGLLSAVQPPSRATHRPQPARSGVVDAARPWSIPLRGPAMALISVQPLTDGFERFQLSWTLDGEAAGALTLGATSEARRSSRVWIPPGPHELEIRSAGAGLSVEVSPWVWRRGILSGVPRRPRPESGIDEAERRYWMGERAEAAEAFARLAGASGLSPAQRALVLARRLETSADPAALVPGPDEMAALPADARALVAGAVLRRADRIPPLVVLGALDDPGLVDPSTLAPWLDSLGGTRARGVALLREASAKTGAGPSLAAAAVREAAARTRWTGLLPDLPELQPEAIALLPGGRREALARLGARSFSTEGSGVARALLGAGQTAALNLPPRAGGRYPILRLESFPAGASVRYSLDGHALQAPRGGSLDISVESGPHELRVQEGGLLLLDPEVLSDPAAQPVVERLTFALPATWEIPDPGFGADLRITTPPDADGAWPTLTARLDSGRAITLRPDDRGIVPLTLGPFETRLALDGPPGARAAVEIRTAALAPPRREEPAAITAGDLAATLRDLSAQLDRARQDGDVAGAAGLRLERAAQLHALGQLDRARRDLAAVLLEDPAADPRMSALQAAAREAWEGSAPEIPSAARLGPQTPEAALAWAGLDLALEDEDPVARARALEQIAARLDRAAPASGGPLWWVAAWIWASLDRAPEALRAALRAGPDADALASRVVGGLAWTPLTRADRGAGLVSVHVQPAPPETGSLGAAVAESLLVNPWPVGEGVALRGDQRDRVSLGGGALELGLYCRDERGPGTPCQVTVRRDQETEILRLEDGAPPTRWSWAPPAGGPGHEVEISGVDPGHVVVVRAQLDGALLPPGVERLALRATPRLPVGLQVAGSGILRVEVSRGAVRIAPRSPSGALDPTPWQATPGQPAWIPLVERGIWNIDIEGDGDILLALGQPGAQTPMVAWALPARGATPVLPSEALLPLFDAWALPAPEAETGAGADGSLRARLSVRRGAVYRPTEPWSAADLDLAWLRREDRWWAWIDGWGGGPRPAGGLGALLGTPLWRGWIAASARGDLSSGLAGGAGRAQGTLTLRQEPGREEAELRARLEAQLRAAWSSQAPRAPVDPRAWTAWGDEHPLTLTLRATALGHPTLDSLVHLGLSATSNSPGGGAPLDQIRLTGSGSLLLGSRGVLSLDASQTRLLADAHRASPRNVTEIGLRQDWIWWLDDRRRLRIFGQFSLRPEASWLRAQGVEGRLGLELLDSARRGLRDLPPDAEAFTTLREAP